MHLGVPHGEHVMTPHERFMKFLKERQSMGSKSKGKCSDDKAPISKPKKSKKGDLKK
jgi:hypothetical protein